MSLVSFSSIWGKSNGQSRTAESKSHRGTVVKSGSSNEVGKAKEGLSKVVRGLILFRYSSMRLKMYFWPSSLAKVK